MLAEVFAQHGLEPALVAGETFVYFRSCRPPSGVVMEDPSEFAMDNWDNVPALQDGARPYFRTRSQAVRTRARGADCRLDTAELLSERDLVETFEGHTWRTGPRSRYPFIDALTEDEVQEFVRSVMAPMLVLTAEQAQVASPFDLAWVAAATPLRHTTLPGGHHLHIENAGPMAREIRDFPRDEQEAAG
ncbi:alpha/beta fold hydrolase [Streptomyces sp. NPDC057271]|uniref:alpha/beta fold hydrolase n=1 Tax=unclassified Streptomyces TaxID=2593676 RepID=UPI00362DAEBE